MEKFMSEVTAIIVPVILTAVGILTAWGLLELKAYVATRNKVLKKKVAQDSTDNLIKTAVVSVEQTLRSEMSTSGQLTSSEKNILKRTALAVVDKQMPEDVIKDMQENVNDLPEYVKSKIEQTVKEEKDNGTKKKKNNGKLNE